ncbi:PAS domain S-box protein [Ramlibacter sp. MAHUQ-53]|uniref:PAS domain S-box protein n=1 Tax=unclassified Ramlibacter TaxID=2617605 RepID=UPI003632517E
MATDPPPPESVFEAGHAPASVLVASLHRLSRTLSVAVIAIGLSGLLGWWLDLPALRRVFPGYQSIVFNTAVLCVAAGLAVQALHRAGDAGAQRLARLLGALTGLVAAVTLLQDLLGHDFGIDQLLLPLGPYPGETTARMAPTTSLGLALCGAAIAWPERPGPQRTRQLLPLAVTILALTALTGYIYGAGPLYRLGGFSRVSLLSASALLLLSLAIVFARAGEGWTRHLCSLGPDGTLWRRLLPLVLVVPLALALINRLGETQGWYDRAVGDAIFSALLVVALLAGIALTARDIAVADERVHETLEAAPAGMIVVNRHGIIELVNSQAERLFGLSRSELVGTSIDALVPDETRPTHAANRARFHAAPSARLIGAGRDLWARRGDGTVFPVEIGLNPLKGSNSGRVVASIIDITARKQAEDELALREQRLRETLEAAPAGMLVVNRQGIIEGVNTRAERLFGLHRDRLVGLGIDALVPDEVRAGHAANRESFHAAPSARAMGHGRDLWARRGDGTVFPVEIGLNPLKGASAGLVLASVIDISARKLAENELALREQRFSAAFEQAAVGMAQVGLDGRWLRVNRKLCDILGYTRSQLLGLTFQDITHPDDLDADLALVRRVLDGEISTYTMEKRYRHQDGHTLWVELTVSLARKADDQPDYFISVVVDIDARKRAEERVIQSEAQIRRMNAELEQTIATRTAELRSAKEEAERANRAKDSLLANVSHEIRTPLNAILGAAQVLERGAQGDQMQVLVRGIRSAGRSLVTVINDLLDLAKIEAGRFEIVPAPFALQDVLSTLADVLQSTAAEKGLWLRIHAIPPQVEAVVGDSQRIGQVLYNLTGNAIKFTDRGGVDVRVEVVRREGDQLTLRFSVQDTGPGVEPGLQPRLFSPFVQGDGHARRQLGGTGLGLAICRQLVTLMGGEIGVDSEPGRGSTFWFTVTLTTISASAISARRESATRPDERRLDGLHVLIVDDAPVNREIARLLLEGEGATVDLAENGQLALERLRAGPQDFDLVLMDVQMPVMDGLEAARHIRNDPQLQRIPVLALTAAALESQRQLALEAGMDDYIVKPFEMDMMVATLLRMTRRGPG